MEPIWARAGTGKFASTMATALFPSAARKPPDVSVGVSVGFPNVVVVVDDVVVGVVVGDRSIERPSMARKSAMAATKSPPSSNTAT